MSSFESYRTSIESGIEAKRLAELEAERLKNEYNARLDIFFNELSDALNENKTPTTTFAVWKPPKKGTRLVKPAGVFRAAVYEEIDIPSKKTIFSAEGWSLHGGEYYTPYDDGRIRTTHSYFTDEVFLLTTGQLGVLLHKGYSKKPDDIENSVFSNGRVTIILNNAVAYNHLGYDGARKKGLSAGQDPILELLKPKIAGLLGIE